jgi:DNA primase
MPKPTSIDFLAIKSAVTIEQVLQHYGLLDRLTRDGDRLSGVCPIHGGDNSTAFHVSLSKNCWNCLYCQAGGNVLDFVAGMERISVNRAAQLLVEWFNLNLNLEPAEPERKPRAPAKPTSKEPAPYSNRIQPKVETQKNTPDLLSEFRLENHVCTRWEAVPVPPAPKNLNDPEEMAQYDKAMDEYMAKTTAMLAPEAEQWRAARKSR